MVVRVDVPVMVYDGLPRTYQKARHTYKLNYIKETLLVITVLGA